MDTSKFEIEVNVEVPERAPLRIQEHNAVRYMSVADDRLIGLSRAGNTYALFYARDEESTAAQAITRVLVPLLAWLDDQREDSPLGSVEEVMFAGGGLFGEHIACAMVRADHIVRIIERSLKGYTLPDYSRVSLSPGARSSGLVRVKDELETHHDHAMALTAQCALHDAYARLARSYEGSKSDVSLFMEMSPEYVRGKIRLYPGGHSLYASDPHIEVVCLMHDGATLSHGLAFMLACEAVASITLQDRIEAYRAGEPWDL